MRQALSRKATPEIPVPGDARGSPPSLQRAVPGGHVARRISVSSLGAELCFKKTLAVSFIHTLI